MRAPFLPFLALAAASFPSFAATPASGTLTPTSGPVNYSTGPLVTANPTPVPLVDTGPTCMAPVAACDSFTLTVSLPPGYAASHNADVIKVTTSWTPVGPSPSDYDLWVYKGEVGNTERSQTPEYRGDGGTNPEVATVFPLQDGDTVYTIKIVPYTPAGETITTRAELVSAEAIDLDPNFGKPTPTVAGAPRYQTLAPPASITNAEDGKGEINIGYNPLTGKIMLVAFLGAETFRITTPDKFMEPLPEACEALWEDVTPESTSGPQPVGDPILFTDAVSGRTWESNLTAGPNVSYAFTDDDGDTWVPVGVSGVAGADHQTIGSGPYPESFALPHPLHENAVYFCSQFLLGPAGCVRSDDGGLTYGPTTLAYDGSVCSGLHGHVRVAPNGAVWLPAETCGTGTGSAVSLDAGMTWTDFVIPASEGKGTLGSDPSVALDADSKAYFCYSDGDGRAKAVTSADNGATWSEPVDLGIDYAIVNTAFPEAWAGDSGRAACGFIGTNQPGNLQSLDFPGIWYVFMAHTYDGGLTWTTVNATPNDPVQGTGGVWHGGGSNSNRNLLDFNEVTADEKGRVLYAYDDGCVRDCAKFPKDNPQSFTAVMKIARQTGGRTLVAASDRVEPVRPSNACLAGTRTSSASNLTWVAPDNGGAEVLNYRVFRSTTPGGAGEFIGNAGPKTVYVDDTADPAVPNYYYTVTAMNSAGEGIASNRIELPIQDIVAETPCASPGVTVLTDPANDIFAVAGGGGTPAQSNSPFYDARSLSISQPSQPDGSFKVYFHLKMQGLASLPPNTTWPISFCSPAFECADVNAAVAASNKYYTLRMRTGPNAAPVYELLVPNAADVTRQTLMALPESGYSADGMITLVVNGSDLGLTTAGATPEPLRNFLVRISVNAQAANPTPDNMPDGVAGAGSYTPVSNAFCLPNVAPVADLTVNPSQGPAPLNSTFIVGGSDADAGDTLASYSLDFGDGESVTDQPFTSLPTMLSHRYAQPGNYETRLTVKDSRGLVSSNIARRTVSVLPGGGGSSTPGGAEGRFGGSALGLLALAPLLALRRRRRS